ncbi:MAG: aquaporin family protein [Polaromonas sp.]|nr:aquaporin family protein [Polaromonas sp.]
MSQAPLKNQLFAEFFGTAALLCAVIGSGIMAVNLSGGNNGVALLANTLATVFALYVLIELLGPVSGAHFNPLVTLVVLFRESNTAENQQNQARAATLFIAFQLMGAVVGAWLANAMFGAMFDLSVLQFSSKVRSGWGQWLGEIIATAGLILVVMRAPAGKAAGLVACYIGAAYWFTSSTSFANPAAVLGRMLSDSFAGIAPGSAFGFVAAQCVGAMLGVALHRALGRTS